MFVVKVKTLVNDEDDKIPYDEKRKIMRMIKKVMENRKHSKIAKEKFQSILEDKCKEYGYDPIQEYCKTCKRDDFDENGDYNPCCHFKEKIDFVKVFEFAKFSKERCNEYDHYAVVSHLFYNKELSRFVLLECNLLYYI
ncbi:44609_t:CDS:1 [Gigaspora margarita]|uniref:44609_t:CDS:1 n=1 Tax=Gigaspora margarita TaxID=4874 RepID=A0ABN7VP16_GIGMA|nr:44609_t:CDS:1 [Gigaspora margarita]